MDKAEKLRTKYLIIGNSAGGIGAAETIREVDPLGRLTIVSAEPFPAYSRPLISEYLTHERTLDTMLFRAADFYKKNNIDLITGQEVNSLDHAARVARLVDGRQVTWDKLLLATGGSPIIPPLPGLDKQGVFSFIRLDDAQRIDEYLAKANRAVVIGGGLIGISITEALSKRGILTTIVEMKDRILNTILDETASASAEAILRREGVRIITGHTVSEISGGDCVEGVILSNGQQLACELVVLAIGVLPRADLASHAGIKVNRGILVDRHMHTSTADVYACGDAAEAYDFVTCSSRSIPIWPNAYIGGRVAGFNMAGRDTEYPGGTSLNSINYFGIDIVSAGLVSAPDDRHYQTIMRRDDGAYKKAILQDGVIKGMIMVKDIDKSGLIYGLMRDGVDVSGFQDAILQDDFGLVHLPVELRRQRLGALSAGQHVVPLSEEEEQPIAGE